MTEGGAATITAGDGAKIKDNFADLAAQCNALLADITSIRTQLVAAIDDIQANNAAIDAINADMATLGLTASS